MRLCLVVPVLVMVGTAPASAATIGFDGLSAGDFATHADGGFTVTAGSGRWSVRDTYGHPAPFIYFDDEGFGLVSDLVTVSAGGALFDFSSVDLYSSITPIPYLLIGYRGAAPIFTTGGTVPNTFGNFATVAANFAGIDSLVIELSNPIAVNPMGLDNIVVSPSDGTPVPEPAVLVLLAAGAGSATRRRWFNALRGDRRRRVC